MLATQQARDAKSKALKIRYILYDCYLFDIHSWLSKSFEGDSIGKFDIDGAILFAYLWKGGKFLNRLVVEMKRKR